MSQNLRIAFSTVLCVAAIAGGTACRSESAPSSERVAPAAPSERLVTLQGCLTETSDARTFILAVPGDVARTVRGIGKGQPVPPGAEAGPKPASPPRSVPPPQPVEPPPFEPQGRFATPTIRNFTYRLEVDTGADLASMVGDTVEVTGMLPTEGYPSGDRPEPAEKPQSIGTTTPVPLTARSVRFVSNGCPGRR